jgi:hypothetical protein
MDDRVMVYIAVVLGGKPRSTDGTEGNFRSIVRIDSQGKNRSFSAGSERIEPAGDLRVVAPREKHPRPSGCGKSFGDGGRRQRSSERLPVFHLSRAFGPDSVGREGPERVEIRRSSLGAFSLGLSHWGFLIGASSSAFLSLPSSFGPGADPLRIASQQPRRDRVL